VSAEIYEKRDRKRAKQSMLAGAGAGAVGYKRRGRNRESESLGKGGGARLFNEDRRGSEGTGVRARVEKSHASPGFISYRDRGWTPDRRAGSHGSMALVPPLIAGREQELGTGR
jgi:hypothetical protein